MMGLHGPPAPHPNIHYYRTRSGRAVDFVVSERGRERQLVQVCETLVDPATRKRETTALMEAMAELRVGSATIVTRHGAKAIDTGSGTIHVVPAWRFLLDLPEHRAGGPAGPPRPMR